MKFVPIRATLLLCVMTAFQFGCEKNVVVKEITETRTVQGPVPIPAGVTTAQRFGMRTASNPAASQNELPFTYDVPEGWTEAPANPMRLVNLVPAGDPRAECYLTVLPGGGGGAEANVNRWRHQMSLDPYTAEEFAALPRKSLLGMDAVYVEFEGTYTGMSGDQNEAGFKLAGLILPLNDRGVFVKMLGPKAVVNEELDAFDAFCQSLTIRPPEAPPETAPTSSSGHVHQDGLELTWDAPEGWTQAPDRPMRAVTFTMGEDGTTECYVSVFPGDAGGLLSNLNRWARQIGVEPLSEPVIAELPTVTIMSAQAPMVEFSGTFSDSMSGIEIANATLLGVIAEHAGHSIFVKLVGPASDVAQQKERFVTFCESIGH